MECDLIKLSQKIESKVIRDGKRLFAGFSVEKNVDSPTFSAVAYSCGCNIGCYYCSSTVRDYVDGKVPDINFRTLKTGGLRKGFYSSEELLNIFLTMAASPSNFGETRPGGKVDTFAILDCETTIGINFIFKFMDSLASYNKEAGTRYKFELFTNGILLGYYPEYLNRLVNYRDCLTIRFSIKAGNEAAFTQRVDTSPEYFQCPFEALKKCIELGIDNYVCVLSDEKIMAAEEFEEINRRLAEVGYTREIYEEKLIMSVSCINRIRKHQEKYPEYEFRFRFRESILLVYDPNVEGTDLVARKLNSGIRRVLGKAGMLWALGDNSNEILYSSGNGNTGNTSVVFITDLSTYAPSEIADVFREIGIEEYGEIILLDVGNRGFDGLSTFKHHSINGEKLKVRTLRELCRVDEASSISPEDIVRAGHNITYFWL